MNRNSSSPRKRVLFVSYLFPPAGGVGVIRATKFIKYLPEYGWDVTVLTAENPSAPLRDESLLDDIPAATIVRKAKTFEPGYAVKQMVTCSSAGAVQSRGGKPNDVPLLRTGTEVSPTITRTACPAEAVSSDERRRQSAGQAVARIYERVGAQTQSVTTHFASRLKSVARAIVNTVLQPDAGILWYPRAVREGLKILRERRHDAIVVSAPPFSSLLIGAALARKTGVPLVLDYRDEWTINKAYFENQLHDRFSNGLQRRMQARVLRAAHTIVATTPGSAQALGELAAAAGSDAVSTHIYNGFDPSDFPAPGERLTRRDYGNGIERLRIAFVGTLWKLTSIEPFVKALTLLARRSPELLDRLEVVIAGRQVGDELAHLETLKSLPCRTVDVGFLDHSEALRLMATSDWLLQLLSDLPSVERVVASKLFEYMGARRPILAITGRGDHWDIVTTLPDATVCLPHETERIAAVIEQRLQSPCRQDTWEADDVILPQFERRQLTAELAQLLDGLIPCETPAHELEKMTVKEPLVGATC